MSKDNSMMLADFFLAKAEANPDHRILTFEGGGVRDDEFRSWQDIWLNAQRIAAVMRDRGMTRGDRFAIALRNHPEFVDAMCAASLLGCVFVSIDPRTRGQKLAYMLNHSGCKGIICGDYNVGEIEQVRCDVAHLDWLLMLETGEEEHSSRASEYRDGIDLAEVITSAVPQPSIDRQVQDPADPLQLIYTSGTTGDPKGVVISNMRLTSATLGGPSLQMTPDDRPYTGLSLTHANAQNLTMLPAMGMGCEVTFSRKFTKSRLWDITRKYNCSVFNLLGGMTTAIYSEPIQPNDSDNPVRMVLSAGMPANIWKKFETRFDLKVVELYGAVDGLGLFANKGDGPIGSFGQVPTGMEFRIVDEDDNEVPPGQKGELIGRALKVDPKVEYFGNQEASDNKTRGGWLRTGDVCHVDESGWFYFDYRKGGGIRHNGDFVNPGFVEQVLAEHAMVNDVFVYGIPAASGAPGEKDVVAAIVARDPSAFEAADVIAHCRRELEPNFVPTYLQVIDEIPKTASEKPLERPLLEMFAEGVSGVYSAD